MNKIAQTPTKTAPIVALTLLLVTTALSGTTDLQQTSKPIPNCLRFDPTTKRCTTCYMSPTSPTTGCGAYQPNNKCFYQQSGVGEAQYCKLCIPGFANTPAGQCVKGNIDNCVFTLVTAEDGVFCGACMHGLYPTFNLKGCGKAYGQNYMANCDWLGNAIDHPFCLKCAKGYVSGRYQNACIKSDLVGCLRLDTTPGKCYWCNVYEGYSMQRDGSCKKVGKSAAQLREFEAISGALEEVQMGDI